MVAAVDLKLSHDVVVGPPLEKSPLDLCSYRAITLSNQLNVVLVSDKRSYKAAAAMEVAVGHFSDPEELPGLAHFLEHMLFLGTEKYPEEGSYNKFLAENGGKSNAYTQPESTVYFYDLMVSKGTPDQSPSSKSTAMPAFKESLDRFSQFFTAPLFTESATERELNAVHSEHQKNLQSDGRRKYEVMKIASNPEHPVHKFGTGSKETLWDKPREAGIDTREALLKFHEKYYSANLMNLCVVGPYDLDELQDWVAELFSEISNHDAPDPSDEYKQIQPLLDEHRGLSFLIETIEDTRDLDIDWIGPSYYANYRSKSVEYISELLGDEGEGSILSILKAKGWANSLQAGMYSQKTYSTARVSIRLTKDGVEHIDEIIGIVYDYVRMLREEGIQERLYQEQSTLAETKFRFSESHSANSKALALVGHMDQCDPAEYLTGAELYMQYNPEEIMEMLAHLTPANGNIYIAGKFVADKTDKKELVYQTAYHVEQIEKSKLDLWAERDRNLDLCVPEPNPFLPSDFDLLAEPLPDCEEDFDGPTEVFRNEFMEVHYKLDRTFKRPKGAIAMELRTPYAYYSPWHAVMTNIYTRLLEDDLREYSYAAERAGCMYALSNIATGISLIVVGYNHRLDVLLDAVVKKIAKYEVDRTRFDMIRDVVEREYMNFEKKQPYAHVTFNRSCLLEEPRWHVYDYLRTLRDGSITVQAMKEFAKNIQNRLFILALVAGNISEESAVAMIKSVEQTIKYRPVPDVEQIHGRVVEVPVGQEVYTRMDHPNLDDNNSAIDVTYEVGPNGKFDRDVRLILLAAILEKPVFHELRTKQQLGYIVHEGVCAIDYVRGLSFIVQSTVASPDELLGRIDAFLVEFRDEMLPSMSEENFQDYVDSLVARKAEPEKQLYGRAMRFWKELESGCRQYDRPRKEIAALKSVTKQDIVTFFDEYIAVGGPQRRRIVSQVYGNLHPFEEKEALPNDSIEVEDHVAFRRQNKLYPCAGA